MTIIFEVLYDSIEYLCSGKWTAEIIDLIASIIIPICAHRTLHKGSPRVVVLFLTIVRYDVCIWRET